MALSVYDLAVEVILYLVAFQRRVEDGETVSYADTRAETLALLSELDRKSHTEPGLWDAWVKARAPLVYLIDEVMILNANWPYRQEWNDECLEVALLGHQSALAGKKFYEDCDEAVRELELAERHERQDRRMRMEIVMVFYVALQTGFKGELAMDLDGWREYKERLFAKLPAYAQTRLKELFPEAKEHTVELDPNYEPVMRLLYVMVGFVLLTFLYMSLSCTAWNEMVKELSGYASTAQLPTASGEPAPAPALPALSTGATSQPAPATSSAPASGS